MDVKYKDQKLKLWVQLNEISEQIRGKLKNRSTANLEKLLYSCLSLGIEDFTKEMFYSLSWQEVFLLLTQVLSQVDVPDIPLLRSIFKKDFSVPWEYMGRTWYSWVNLLASHYHWDIEYIEKLAVKDALCLLQEILVSDQLKKEWEWGLTELAYPYNDTTKKSEFKALPRPEWMQESAPAPKKIRILKSMLPIGNVVDIGDVQGQFK